MKNFILGCLFILLTAAGTASIMTVKPATPKATIIVSAWDTPELNKKIKPYLQKGYVVKNVAAGDGARVVIMEKY